MKSAVLLYNPQSGRGKIDFRVEEICTVFRAYGYDIRPQQIDFAANPFDGNETLSLMVVAGGDGTLNFALNAMKRKGLDIPFGVIPAGTANDFAGALGMSRHPLEAARQIAQGVEERVDCGCVNGLYFVNVFSFGIFTTTSQRTPDGIKHRIGKLAYIIEGVKEVSSMHAVPLEIEADGERFDLRSLMVLIFNGETAGGFRLARRASIKDGLLDCILLEKRDPLRSALAMGQYLLGGNPKIVRHLRARQIEIRSTVNEPTDVDGQPGAEFPLHITCQAGGLRMICPRRSNPPPPGADNAERARMKGTGTRSRNEGRPRKWSVRSRKWRGAGTRGPERAAPERNGQVGAKRAAGVGFSVENCYICPKSNAESDMMEYGKTKRGASATGREGLHKV